jgi:hypothetical protein
VDVKPGENKYGLYETMDNVYAPSKMGTTNLFLDQPAHIQEASQLAEQVETGLNRIYNFSASPQELTEVKILLSRNPSLAGTPQAQAVENAVDYINKSYTSIKTAETELNNVRDGFLWPILYKDAEGNQPYFKMLYKEREALAKDRGFLPGELLPGDTPFYRLPKDDINALTEEAGKTVERQIMEEANKRLKKLGGSPIDLNSFTFQSDSFSSSLGRSTPGFEQVVKDAVEPVEMKALEASTRIKRHIKPVIEEVSRLLNSNKLYAGQHPTVTQGTYPIGFARFTEHQATVPGHGTLQGRHYHELQSDLAQDIRSKGAKTGNVEKDKVEFDSLSEKRQKIMLDLVDNPPATEQARAAVDVELAKLDDRIGKLNNRMIAAKRGGQTYYLEEPFAGTENRSSVVQQLLMKNAIQAAMREGQNFVTFPGTSSAQAHLYEGVRNNLKQVIKDLGGEKSGLELQMIELPPTTKEVTNKRTGQPTHEVGKPLNAVGIVWGPEAAARITKNGIPFAKGGMVERNTSDNRRYL